MIVKPQCTVVSHIIQCSMCHLLPSLFHNILIDPQIQMTETQKNSTEMISCKGQIVVLKLKRESRENDHDKEKEGNKNREYIHKY